MSYYQDGNNPNKFYVYISNTPNKRPTRKLSEVVGKVQQIPKSLMDLVDDSLFSVGQWRFPIASSNFMNARTDLKYARNDENAFVFDKRTDIKNENVNQFMDNLGINPYDKGVAYGYQSPYSQQLYKSNQIQNYLKNNAEHLHAQGNAVSNARNNNKSYVSNPKLIDFGDGDMDNQNPKKYWDNFLSLQHATLYNPHIDDKGYFNATVTDKFDFNLRPLRGISDLINNAGYYLQEKGILKTPFYMYNIHEKVPDEMLNKEI